MPWHATIAETHTEREREREREREGSGHWTSVPGCWFCHQIKAARGGRLMKDLRFALPVRERGNGCAGGWSWTPSLVWPRLGAAATLCWPEGIARGGGRGADGPLVSGSRVSAAPAPRVLPAVSLGPCVCSAAALWSPIAMHATANVWGTKATVFVGY